MKSAVLFLLLAASACGPASARHGDDAATQPDAMQASCTDGVTRCMGTDFQTCTGGQFTTTTGCLNLCDPALGCVNCAPGSGTCMGNTAHVCKPDGSGYVDQTCDPALGVTCDPGSGTCVGDCAPDKIGSSYIGCEYYPTITGNIVPSNFQFAVAVANTSSATAMVTIDEGPLPSPLTFMVAAGDVVVEKLPWDFDLKCDSSLCAASVLKMRGAFHVRSTEPVTVYQFNALDYTDGLGSFSYTNDASLLLPVNALTGDYMVAAWENWSGYPGEIAITAVTDGTHVTVTPAAPVNAGAVPGMSPGVPSMITLNRGDVVELPNPSGDLTGTEVLSDLPVQVIGGHICTDIPIDITACDHVEESIFPVEALSTEYVATAPAVPSIPNGKEEFIRVLATQDATTVTIDPPPPGFPATATINKGAFVELPRMVGDYDIKADHKVVVAQYMEGQDAGGATGDPAMTLAVPVDQYRTNYLFHAPTNYEVNYVNITAPVGATVMLDGAVVSGFTQIGTSGFAVARQTLPNGATGNHTATSTMKFGITVYGYGQYTSYWYPGGLDLMDIPISRETPGAGRPAIFGKSSRNH